MSRKRIIAPRCKKKHFELSPKLSRGIFWSGIFFIGLGIVLFLFPLVYKAFQNVRPGNLKIPGQQIATRSAAVAGSAEPIKIDSKLLGNAPQVQIPQRVVLPTASIDLPVVEAPVINGYWELSDTSASHGVGSANPGENGNIVIFAHAREGLFMNLRNVKKDDTIYVLSQDRWFRYKVTDYKLVDPTAIETIAPTTDETLTLYTCDGFLDAKRLIVVAKPLV